MTMFKGKKRLQKQLRKIPDSAKAEMKRALTMNGAEADRYMSALIPVLTGETKISIFYFIRDVSGGIQLTVVAGHDGAPARMVEFVNETPFFYPVIRLNHKRWTSRIKRHINKSVKLTIAGG